MKLYWSFIVGDVQKPLYVATEKPENGTKTFREEINTIYNRLLGEITMDLGKEIK